MDEYNPYKNMTLRQELEARFAEVDRKQKEQDALDYIRNNMQFSPNNAGNINTGQQPNGWSSPTNNNSGFGVSTVGQHIDNAVHQPNNGVFGGYINNQANSSSISYTNNIDKVLNRHDSGQVSYQPVHQPNIEAQQRRRKVEQDLFGF